MANRIEKVCEKFGVVCSSRYLPWATLSRANYIIDVLKGDTQISVAITGPTQAITGKNAFDIVAAFSTQLTHGKPDWNSRPQDEIAHGTMPYVQHKVCELLNQHFGIDVEQCAKAVLGENSVESNYHD
jgi:hypothetical protein